MSCSPPDRTGRLSEPFAKLCYLISAPRLPPQPTNGRPTACAPGPRHAPHVAELRTRHHVLTQRPRPTHFDAHRVVAFMQREHVRTQSRSGGQRRRIPVGLHAESHAPTGNEISAVTFGSNAADLTQMLQSPSPGSATILLRKRATSAPCTIGSTHRATAGARPTRPKTVTSPDATDDHQHQLWPWTI